MFSDFALENWLFFFDKAKMWFQVYSTYKTTYTKCEHEIYTYNIFYIYLNEKLIINIYMIVRTIYWFFLVLVNSVVYLGFLFA